MLGQVHGTASGDIHPPWAYWLDDREIAVMAGRCYVEAGEILDDARTLAEPVGSGRLQARIREVAA